MIEIVFYCILGVVIGAAWLGALAIGAEQNPITLLMQEVWAVRGDPRRLDLSAGNWVFGSTVADALKKAANSKARRDIDLTENDHAGTKASDYIEDAGLNPADLTEKDRAFFHRAYDKALARHAERAGLLSRLDEDIEASTKRYRRRLSLVEEERRRLRGAEAELEALVGSGSGGIGDEWRHHLPDRLRCGCHGAHRRLRRCHVGHASPRQADRTSARGAHCAGERPRLHRAGYPRIR